MNSKEIYSIIISKCQNLDFILKKKFLCNFQWKEIYTLPSKVTVNAYLRQFQYKITNYNTLLE